MKHQFKNGCFKNRYIIVVQIELGNEFLLFKRETFIIKPVFIYSYGAQNEAYMSRSAEKWVRGLCFNELGVGG